MFCFCLDNDNSVIYRLLICAWLELLKARNTGKGVWVFFGMTNCVDCRHMHSIYAHILQCDEWDYFPVLVKCHGFVVCSSVQTSVCVFCISYWPLFLLQIVRRIGQTSVF
jgi:hypothetical protein